MSKSIGVSRSGQTDVLVVKGGQRGGGKSYDAVKLQIWDEMSEYAPATLEEAEAYCRIQIKRCNINLANAKERGDKRAALHLERKLAVYQLMHQLAKTAPTTSECSHCRVAAMENGVCACCGTTEEAAK